MHIDPITLEIIANRLDEIQRIMKSRLFRTGYSTILRESFDGGAGLTDADGRVIGAWGMTIHTRPYAKLAEGVLSSFGKDGVREGDVFISNDPYHGGVAHSPDMGVATPVFIDGRLIAFCISVAHKPDIGGLAPGSASPASRSIYHEGIIIPPCKLFDRGQLVDSVKRILENNSRTPKLLIGDLMGQVGCTRVGAQLVQDLVAREGVETILEVIKQLMDSSERRVREALKAVPDGVVSVESFLDGDGAVDRPVKIALKATKKGDSLTLDFTGSDPQTAGPANTVPQAIEASALGALVGVLDYTIANNDGVRRPVTFILPEGSVVNPTWPAPVNSYIPTSHLVFNGVLQVIGTLLPERASAESGLGLGGLALGYSKGREGGGHVHYEITLTATGGTARGDGASAFMPMVNMESIQPIEIVESEFPVRITDFSMLKDSCGAGQHRGGIGNRREFEMLEDAQLVSRMSQRRFGTKGLAGGKGSPISRTVVTQGTKETDLPGLAQQAMKAGERVRIEQTGGGGWGDPKKRDPEAVLRDVDDGFVSLESARRDYGVLISAKPSGELFISGSER